ncbi:MAG: hypothetical protein AB1861_29190 [Cyanobacteriota bacterium]
MLHADTSAIALLKVNLRSLIRTKKAIAVVSQTETKQPIQSQTCQTGNDIKIEEYLI